MVYSLRKIQTITSKTDHDITMLLLKCFICDSKKSRFIK